MRNGTYYLNNTGHRWVNFVNGKKEQITLKTKSGKEVTRTAIYYEAFGNFAAVCVSYCGKRITVLTDSLLDDCQAKKRTITAERARAIASQWHGGQWSALYQFASSGIFHVPNTLKYFQELEFDLEPEFWNAKEVTRTKKDLKELNSLKKYLLQLAAENAVPVEFEKSNYGYQIPYLMESVSEDVAQTVTPVAYMR